MHKKEKSFWCEAWEQWVYESVCVHRFKKGLKKCEGCEKGKKLLNVRLAELKEENERHAISHNGY